MSPAPLPGPPAGGGARTSCSDPPLGEQLLSPQCAWPWGHLWAQLSNSRKRRLPCRWARGWASLGLEGRLTRASTSCLLSSLVSLYPSLWLLGAAAGTSPGSSLQGASEKSPSHGGGCREPLSSSPVYRERQSLARAWRDELSTCPYGSLWPLGQSPAASALLLGPVHPSALLSYLLVPLHSGQ